MPSSVGLMHGFDLNPSQGQVAYPYFGGLVVEVSRHDPLAEELEAVHLRREATSGVVIS